MVQYADQDPDSVLPYIVRPDELAQITSTHYAEGRYDDAAYVFKTSGDPPKIVPFYDEAADRFIDNVATALQLPEDGVTGDDGVLSLAAPEEEEHQSGPGFTNASQRIGADVLNSSFKDYDRAMDRREDVNVVLSLPLLLYSVGEEIVERYDEFDSPADAFPNARVAITGGDRLTPSIRDLLKEDWGFDAVYSMYAATEYGPVAIEDGNGDMVVIEDDARYLELLDEDADVDPVSGRIDEDMLTPVTADALDDAETGVLVGTEWREGVPLPRYKAGDVVTAYTDANGEVRMVFEGRDDYTINVSGAPLYEDEIDGVLEDLHGTMDYWLTVASKPAVYPALDVFVPEEAAHTTDDDELLDALLEQNQSVRTAYDADAIDYVRQHTYESKAELQEMLADFDLTEDPLANPVKPKRIAFTESYYA